MKNNLFNLSSMEKYLNNFDYSQKRFKLQEYIKRVNEKEFKGETKGYPAFLKFLEEILDYEEAKHIAFDDKVAIGNGRVEFALKNDDGKFMVIELKGQGIDLDKPQNRVNDKRSPVEQAFGYAEKSNKESGLVDWIFVSNYEEFRLYNYGKRQGEYISFNINDLLKDEKEFKHFMFVFSKESHIDLKIINEIINEEYIEKDKLAKNFYKLFNETRLMIIKELEELHDIKRIQAISYAQTILDRFIFICFAGSREKGNRKLLPEDIAHKTLKNRIKVGNFRDYEIWRELNYLFRDVDKGKEDEEGNPDNDITGYNGGLFKDDLKEIKIKDILEKDFFKDIQKKNLKNKNYKKFITELNNKVKKEIKPSILNRINPIYLNLLIISNFDFSDKNEDYNADKLDIDILGHIFENSIGDIEELKKDSKGRRKKDGIFYTPDYITDYICRNTIIPYLSKSGNISDVDDLIKEYSWGSDMNQLDQKMKNIKILDPACGSGAFLNKATDILLEIHEAIYNFKTGSKKSTSMRVGKGSKRRTKMVQHLDLGAYVFDTMSKRREILLDNIFGVDLNSESVEITKLSLFLKVCEKDVPLPSLDNNIKCGNSLIEDPDFTDKPFNWGEKFDNVFKNGGFDIIIGNPPYFNVQTLGAKSVEVDYLKSNYSEIWMDKSDILFYFIGKSVELSNRYVSFIISNAFLFADKAEKLRNFIIDKAPISKIVNFERYMVFDDASITTAIIELDKLKEDTTARGISLKKKKYKKIELLNKINDEDNYFDVELKKDDIFAIVSPDEYELNKRIDNTHPKLGNIVHVGKGMETGANPIFTFKEYPKQFSKEFIKKRMSGEIIHKYFISKEEEYLLYFEDINDFEKLPKEIQDYLLENKTKLSDRADKKRRKTAKWWNYTFPLHKEFYHLDKIWTSYRSSENCFVLDQTNEYIGLTNTTVIFDTNEEISLKYILTLLNSKLLTFRYRTIGKQTGNGIFEYFENQISKLPIPHISQKEQQPFIKLADDMIEINKKLQLQIDEYKSWLNNAFEINEFSKQLEKFYELSFDEFIKEVKNSKVNIKNPDNFSALKCGYDKYGGNINSLNLEIKDINDKIDDKVYQLYGITEDRDIQLINF